jgi:mono/diheme cytochrome c family protein
MAKSSFRFLAFLAALLLTGQALAGAEDRADTSRGADYARAWCAACHAVERGEKAEAFSTAPSFQSLSENPELTAIALHAYLQTPHNKMLNVILRPEQADEIVAYILSLKQK